MTRWGALALLSALVVLCAGWELMWAPLPGGSGALAIKALPLLLAAPGVWRMRMYTYRWLSLLIWIYVAEGLLRATSEKGISAYLAGLEVVLSVALFMVCSWHIRHRLKSAPVAGSTTQGP